MKTTESVCWWCESNFDEESPAFRSVIHNGEPMHPACAEAAKREAQLEAAFDADTDPQA